MVLLKTALLHRSDDALRASIMKRFHQVRAKPSEFAKVHYPRGRGDRADNLMTRGGFAAGLSASQWKFM